MIGNLTAIIVVVLLILVPLRAGREPIWADAYRRIAKDKMAVLSILVICLYGGVALLDSISWSDHKNMPPRTIIDRLFEVPQEHTYSAPMATMTTVEPHPHKLLRRHLLGTDILGNDVLYETLRGCRTAIIIGGLTQLIATPLALLFGLIAGYFGKWADDLIQYVYTVLDSIPSILLLVVLIMVMGHGLTQICVALGVTSWVYLCRLVRGETLKHRDRDYVRAARALGLSHWRILIRHILPNLIPVVIITATLGFSSNVLAETILSYLQLGVPPDVGSWGNMIDSARQELSQDPIVWWNLLSASTALFFLVLAANIFGDALRDAVDPRLRSS
ncbi:MAG: ABC transporter permease [Capsulimonadaceae bacterium]